MMLSIRWMFQATLLSNFMDESNKPILKVLCSHRFSLDWTLFRLSRVLLLFFGRAKRFVVVQQSVPLHTLSPNHIQGRSYSAELVNLVQVQVHS